MRYVIILIYLLAATKNVCAQDLSGRWQGDLLSNYKWPFNSEAQIEQLRDHRVKGVTDCYEPGRYHYITTTRGYYDAKTKVLNLKEIKLLKFKSHPDGFCLITFHLRYQKKGKLETLVGNFTSRDIKTGLACPSGRAHFTKTALNHSDNEISLVASESDERESSNITPKQKTAGSNPIKTEKNNLNNVAAKKSTGISTIGENLVNDTSDKTLSTYPDISFHNEDLEIASPPEKKEAIPEVIITRKNEIVKTFIIPVSEIKIDVYDNGEIDGDTISIYDNNELIAFKKRLTDKPLTFSIYINDTAAVHEFVMVAENLGSIPPNTALMVITANGKRDEVFISTSEQKNAVIVFKYQAQQKK